VSKKLRLRKSKNKIYGNPLTWSLQAKLRKVCRSECKISKIRLKKLSKLTYRNSGRKIKK